MWRLTTLQHGSVFITSRQYCAVKSDVVDHSLRFTREILLRDTPHSVVAGFEQVKLREGVKPKTRQTLSRVWLDVEFAVRLFFVFIAYVFAHWRPCARCWCTSANH